MGCFSSKASEDAAAESAGKARKEKKKKLQRPKPWRHPEPITKQQLDRMRDEFWDTQPHYGGHREIWDALKAAAEADLPTAQAIIDSAGIILESNTLTVTYDERGAKYELPNYVLCEPVNLKS